jgi:hypothetical protein
MIYRVRERMRNLHGMDGKVNFYNYFVYCSGEFSDYYEAILYAVDYEKTTGISCWVDCMNTYDYFEEKIIPFGWV